MSAELARVLRDLAKARRTLTAADALLASRRSELQELTDAELDLVGTGSQVTK